MATVLITGGTGMVGRAITQLLLQQGYKVIVLTRKIPALATPGIQYALWNVAAQTIDATAVQQADYIIHLAGEGVADKRWTEKRKKEIVESRTQSSALLIKTLQQTPHQVKAFISAAAQGWYGPDIANNNTGFTENMPAATDFLGTTCQQWEASVAPVTALGIRLVKLRIGIVLGAAGGALPAFKKPVQMGVAAILSSGQQVISWIAVDDLSRMFLQAIENGTMYGAYNAAAPNPVTNKTLMLTLAKHLRGRFYIPIHVPAWVLKLMLGEMSIEVLKSVTLNVQKIQQTGFKFAYPTIEAALNKLLPRS